MARVGVLLKIDTPPEISAADSAMAHTAVRP